MPSGFATSRSCARCAINSAAVWCTFSTGAPESSNCPPGSSEMAPPWVTSNMPMMLSPSMIGSQPSRSCMPSSSARMLRAAGIRHRPVPSHREGEFLVLGADAELRLRLAARFEPGDEFVARLDGGHVDLVTSHARFRRKKGRDLKHGTRERAMRDGVTRPYVPQQATIGAMPRPQRAFPTSWATMKAGTPGAMPANVFVKARATVTAGLAKEVDGREPIGAGDIRGRPA